MRLPWIVPLLTLASLVAPGPLPAGSSTRLHTEFGEVRLQRLAIGKSYSVWRLAETALVFCNKGPEPLDVRTEIVVPSHHDLRPGARALPDLAWVGLERSRFHLPGHATVRADVRVTLPYDPELAGKTFQVDLWTGVVDAHGRRHSGQMHRLLFTVAMDYRDDTEAQFSLRMTRP
jgi:hypothetical protein